MNENRPPLEEELAQKMAREAIKRRAATSPEEQLRRVSWLVSADVLKGVVDEERIQELLQEMERKEILVAGLGKANLQSGYAPEDTVWTTGISLFIARCFQDSLGDPMATIESPFFDTSRTLFDPTHSLARLGITTTKAVQNYHPQFEYKSPAEVTLPKIPMSEVQIVGAVVQYSDDRRAREKGIIIETQLFNQLEQAVIHGPQLGTTSTSSIII